MYRRILVPLDGSERAEKILPHVEGLAKCLDAEVILLRVFEPDWSQVDYFGHPPEFYEGLREDCRAEALDYLSLIQNEYLGKGLRVQVCVEEGAVVKTIISVAEREDANLIAMSSHGRTGLSHVFYGSVAAGVLHQVNQPLLLVRSEEV
jgi:nucleotide-binding universal stress UspA family protein